MDTRQLQRDLENYAKENPIAVAELCGNLMGGLLRQSESFLRTCGTRAFLVMKVYERIDFLYRWPSFFPKDKDVLHGSIRWDCDEKNRFMIQDLTNKFGRMNIMIFPKDEQWPTLYQIRDLTGKSKNEPPVEWIFDTNSMLIFEPSLGFYDFRKTKLTAMMIKWFTNVLGFSRHSENARSCPADMSLPDF